MTDTGQKQSFEEWKNEAIDYLHGKAKQSMLEGATEDMWDWILGDDEDMMPSYNEGETPAQYVDYQIECAQ